MSRRAVEPPSHITLGSERFQAGRQLIGDVSGNDAGIADQQYLAGRAFDSVIEISHGFPIRHGGHGAGG